VCFDVLFMIVHSHVEKMRPGFVPNKTCFNEFRCKVRPDRVAGLPDGVFSNQKYHFGSILEGLVI
jgi:hypothetical protein